MLFSLFFFPSLPLYILGILYLLHPPYFCFHKELHPQNFCFHKCHEFVLVPSQYGVMDLHRFFIYWSFYLPQRLCNLVALFIYHKVLMCRLGTWRVNIHEILWPIIYEYLYLNLRLKIIFHFSFFFCFWIGWSIIDPSVIVKGGKSLQATILQGDCWHIMAMDFWCIWRKD